MRKMSQTEELVKILAGRARRHTLTPEQISRNTMYPGWMRCMRRWKPGASV